MNLLEEEYGIWEGFEYRSRKPSNTLVENMGLNNSPFVVQPTILNKRVTHPAYSVWHGMLKRSFNLDFKNRRPTYLDVTCCDEWLLFTNFAKWFKDNYIEGYHLDKDLLIRNNKVYGPNTCIFITQELNLFLTLRDSCRGNLPLGVTLHKGRFRSQINNGKSHKYLGRFNTPEEAHRTWQKAKLEQAIAFNFQPLQRVIDQLKFEIENNLETISL